LWLIACSLTCGKEEDSFEARDLSHVQVQHLQLLHLLLEYPATEEFIIDLVLTGQICLLNVSKPFYHAIRISK
jgi:hypothetical protein